MIHRCPFCSYKTKSVRDLDKHVEQNHINQVPKAYYGDVSHFLYDLRNPRGKCQICGAPTMWNTKLKRYNILCGTFDDQPHSKAVAMLYKLQAVIRNKGNTCEDIMRKSYVENIKRVYNTDNLMNDPEYHKLLLENRKIAEKVEYNGKVFTCIGKYEANFLRTLEESGKKYEIEMPGPVVHVNDKGITYTISDVYLPAHKLIISIKDPGANPNYKNHYYKSSVVFWYITTKTNMKMIELNTPEQIKNCIHYIEGCINGTLKPKDLCPDYMKRETPDLYKDIENR